MPCWITRVQNLRSRQKFGVQLSQMTNGRANAHPILYQDSCALNHNANSLELGKTNEDAISVSQVVPNIQLRRSGKESLRVPLL